MWQAFKWQGSKSKLGSKIMVELIGKVRLGQYNNFDPCHFEACTPPHKKRSPNLYQIKFKFIHIFLPIQERRGG